MTALIRPRFALTTPYDDSGKTVHLEFYRTGEDRSGERVRRTATDHASALQDCPRTTAFAPLATVLVQVLFELRGLPLDLPRVFAAMCRRIIRRRREDLLEVPGSQRRCALISAARTVPIHGKLVAVSHWLNAAAKSFAGRLSRFPGKVVCRAVG